MGTENQGVIVLLSDSSASMVWFHSASGIEILKSRFLGVLKTYRLTYESVAPMHAVFSRDSANNAWSIASKTLREFIEHFGPGTEQLDIYSENGRVSFTSYTEKIISGKGICSSE